MIKEDGFVLPLSVMLIFIILAAVLSLAVTYDRDLHFVQEQKNMLALDRLEQCAYADISEQIKIGQPLMDYEAFSYEEGMVQLSLYKVEGGQRTYEFLETISLEYKRKNWLIVDDKTKHIVRWVEGS